MDNTCFCSRNSAGWEGHWLNSIHIIALSLHTFVKLSLMGMPPKGKENLQAWLGKVRDCLLLSIICINNFGIVSALDARN